MLKKYRRIILFIKLILPIDNNYFFNTMNHEELTKLKDLAVQKVLSRLEKEIQSPFGLKRHATLPARAIAEQISCRKRAYKKIPVYYNSHALYESSLLQMCSSEATARYKASLMHGNTLVDGTAGLGIDAIFASQNFVHTICCEKNKLYCELLEYNFHKLGNKKIIVKNIAFEDFLNVTKYVDWIYLDPSRRDSTKRYIALENYTPDISAMINLIEEKTTNWCIKASPMIDISATLIKLPNIKEIQAISYKGECRELLFIGGNKGSKSYNISCSAIIINKHGTIESKVQRVIGEKANIKIATNIKKFIYEPDPAIIKVECTDVIADKFLIKRIGKGINYLTSDKYIKDFPGRLFEIIKIVKWQRKKIRLYLKNNAIKKAMIARRDFPIPPEKIRKMIEIKDGADAFLIFTRNKDGEKIMIHSVLQKGSNK